MTHTDLIARLRGMGIQWCDEAADALTAQQKRIEALEGALQEERALSDRLAGALEYVDDYSLSYPDLGVLSAVAQPAIQDHAIARAALDTTGKGGDPDASQNTAKEYDND